MRSAIRELKAAGRRDELVVVLQSYARWPWLLEVRLARELRALGLDHADVLLLGGDDAARHKLVAEARLGGDDDDCLRGVGGEQLLAEGVAAVEQRAARQHGGDDAVVRRRERHRDAVAAGDVAFLAAGEAEGKAAAVQRDFVLPPEGGDDGAGLAQGRGSASIFAAQIRSLRETPPTECVDQAMRQRL